MDLRADFDAIRRASNDVSGLAGHVAAASARTESAIETASSGAGPGALRSGLSDLASTMRTVGPRLTRELARFGEELEAAAAALARTDSDLADDAPRTSAAVGR